MTSGEANRTLIGKALNRPIHEGEYIHLGVAPKRDGLNACVRRSLVVVDDPSRITPSQQYWFDFIEEAYRVGEEAYRRVAKEGLPAYLQEQALVDFFASHNTEVSRSLREADLIRDAQNLTLVLIMLDIQNARNFSGQLPWIRKSP